MSSRGLSSSFVPGFSRAAVMLNDLNSLRSIVRKKKRSIVQIVLGVSRGVEFKHQVVGQHLSNAIIPVSGTGYHSWSTLKGLQSKL